MLIYSYYTILLKNTSMNLKTTERIYKIYGNITI